MINVDLLSLSAGQSYKNVRLFEPEDFAKNGICNPFEGCAICFDSDGQRIISHFREVGLIRLNTKNKAGDGCLFVARMVLNGDIVYENVKIIKEENWASLGIPKIFPSYDDISKQMAFCVDSGTYITHDTNCVSLVIANLSRKLFPATSKSIEKESKYNKVTNIKRQS